MGFDPNPDVDPDDAVDPGVPDEPPRAPEDENAEPAAPAEPDPTQQELARLREDNARLQGALAARYGQGGDDYGRRAPPTQKTPSFDESVEELAGETGIPVERLRGAFQAHGREVAQYVQADVMARVAAENFIRDFFRRFRALRPHGPHVQTVAAAWLADPRNAGRNISAPDATIEIAKRAHADLRLAYRDFDEDVPAPVEVVPAGNVRKAHVASGRPSPTPAAPPRKVEEEDDSDWMKGITDRQTKARTPGRLNGVVTPK